MIKDDELVSVLSGNYKPDTQSMKYYPNNSQWFRDRRLKFTDDIESDSDRQIEHLTKIGRIAYLKVRNRIGLQKWGCRFSNIVPLFGSTIISHSGVQFSITTVL
jgi:hypothetical protein